MHDMEAILSAVFREGEENARFEKLKFSGLQDDEVLVRIVASGICHTDLTCRSGFMAVPRPVVLGHEGSGIVEQVGAAVRGLAPGDPVVLSFLSCGSCARCTAREPSYCRHFMPANLSGRRLDGSTALFADSGEVAGHFFAQSSFATHSIANIRNTVKVRADAPLEMLGPLGCGIQTGAGSVVNVLRPNPGESLVVLGAGGVGLSAVMAGRVEGCAPIVVVEPNPARRALALELGAHAALDPALVADVTASLKELTDGGANHVVDTCGIPAVIGQAIAALAIHGQIVLLTANTLEATITLPLLGLVAGGVRIYGVNMGNSVPQEFIPHLVDLFMAGRFPIDRLMKFYDFADINQALADQQQGLTVKPVLRMG